MSPGLQKVGEVILLVLCGGVVAWSLYWWVKRSRDSSLLARLIITGCVILFMVFVVGKMFNRAFATGGMGGAMEALMALALAGFCGCVMAVVWVPAITGFVSKVVGSLYDGGDAEVEARPYYSAFMAKRSKGKYFEALAEVRQQLEKFPTDFEGHMLLAELQAEHLNDLPGAEVTILRLCEQPGHLAVNVAYALNHLADWHLSLTKDREAAQRALDKIIELLPDSEMSQQAIQRIAHLADTELLLSAEHRRRVPVKKGVENLGLLRERGKLKAPEVDQGQLAADYVEHLQRHPLDTEAREKLAVVYANHYHRLDLALEQLEQLVHMPNHSAKQAVHWLNLMADLQVQEGAELERVRETLQRIIDQDPEVAAAENARRRLETLSLEFKARGKSHSVQLGTYEQNIGLKGRA